jgi:hypothetical protein
MTVDDSHPRNTRNHLIRQEITMLTLDTIPTSDLQNRTADESTNSIATDHDLRARIVETLAQRGLQTSDDLGVDVHDRVVTVYGHVASYYQRQLIVHSARLVPGVDRVRDSLEVVAAAHVRRSLCRPDRFRTQWRCLGRIIALMAISHLISSTGQAACEFGTDSTHLAGGEAM